MKKLLVLAPILFLAACAQDELIVTQATVEVPQALEIKNTVGIRTESIIVQEEVRMNVKLPYSGQYRIKLRDIKGTLISQELILVNFGNNLLKVYVSTLPKSSYLLELTDLDHKVLGTETIVVN